MLKRHVLVEDIDYDKLIMRIDTDGAEHPREVLHYSVSVLRTQLEHFLLIQKFLLMIFQQYLKKQLSKRFQWKMA